MRLAGLRAACGQIGQVQARLETPIGAEHQRVIWLVDQDQIAHATEHLLGVGRELAQGLRLLRGDLGPIGVGQLPEPLSGERLLLLGRQAPLPVLAALLDAGGFRGCRLVLLELIGWQQVGRGITRRVDEPREDIGRVVELDDLGDGLHHLLLVVPLVVRGVLVGEARGPRLVRGVVDEMVLVVVDEDDGADLREALAVGIQEAAQLLGRLVQEIPPLELCLLGELAEGLDPGRGHGLYTKSGPIRSRRKMMCFFSKIDSAMRWPNPRAEGSA